VEEHPTPTARGTAHRWLSRRHPRQDAEVQLFCLPYAGSGTSAFHGWSDSFGQRVEVSAVRLPGRENRLRERPEVDPAAVARAIDAAAEKPYALFGHSMGARLAFEVIRELRHAGRPLPLRLYPSALGPPDQRIGSLFDGASRLPDDELAERAVAAGGLPAAVLTMPGMLAVFLPALRADLRWVDEYGYVPGEPLPIPVVAFAGTADPMAPGSAMTGWAAHTSSRFTLHELPGNHFFLHDNVSAIASIIEADLFGDQG